MKTINCLIFSLVVALFLSGCDVVTSLNPVGTNPIQIQKDDWEGVWYSGVEKGGMVFYVWVKDKDKGILRFGVVKEDEKEKDFTLMKLDVQLRKGKSSVFGNILFKQMGNGEETELVEKSYLWFMIENAGDSIVIHVPNANIFKELVKDGKHKGEAVSSKAGWVGFVVICEPTEKITDVIESYDDSGKLFNWKSPIMLRRIMKGTSSF